MMKRVIAFEDFPAPYSGSALAKTLRNVFVNFNMENKIMSITLDTASNNTSTIAKNWVTIESLTQLLEVFNNATKILSGFIIQHLHWRGKAPEWADNHVGDHEDKNDNILISGSVVLEKRYDRRLSRLVENRLYDKEEIRADHRRIRQAEIVSNEKEEKMEVEEDDENTVYEHRRMLKDKMLQKEQEEKAKNIVEKDEEDKESEYEMDSEDKQMGSMAIMKPVFVKKSKMRVEERKAKTKKMLVEEIRKDMEIQKNKETMGEIDTNDDENIFKAWIPREIQGLKEIERCVTPWCRRSKRLRETSFIDGLQESVSHLPILTDSIILILVLSLLAESSTDLLILYRLAVFSEIANSFFSFRHGELITIISAVVKPALGELSVYGYPAHGSVML
nr:hypothetical protein [Tanacetum cinerariifolium]